mgnify:FL=1
MASNLPPGVNDVDPPGSPLDIYLEKMSEMDFQALGLSDDLSLEQVDALNHLWDAAWNLGYGDGLEGARMGP